MVPGIGINALPGKTQFYTSWIRTFPDSRLRLSEAAIYSCAESGAGSGGNLALHEGNANVEIAERVEAAIREKFVYLARTPGGGHSRMDLTKNQ